MVGVSELLTLLLKNLIGKIFKLLIQGLTGVF